MTPTEAAKLIGCTPQQVRTQIRRGVICARRVALAGTSRYCWDIHPQEVARYRDKPQPCGFPRGQSRT
jgi:hypothetical protein